MKPLHTRLYRPVEPLYSPGGIQSGKHTVQDCSHGAVRATYEIIIAVMAHIFIVIPARRKCRITCYIIIPSRLELIVFTDHLIVLLCLGFRE